MIFHGYVSHNQRVAGKIFFLNKSSSMESIAMFDYEWGALKNVGPPFDR